jgi:hypothetical protein
MAAELGRAGGRRNRHVVETACSPLPALDSVSGVKSALAQTIVDVHEKRLPPRTAAGLAPLFNTLLRTLDTEEQLQELKNKLKKLEERMDKQDKEVGEQFSAHAAAAGSSSTG